MTSLKKTLVRALAGAAWLALLAGCSGPPTRYYSLAAPGAPAVARAPAIDGARDAKGLLYIEFAPLVVPERLVRDQMVVRRAGTAAPQVDVLEQHRWAASFESELRDALAAAVVARLGAVDASRGGRPAGQPAVRIAVQVHRFDMQEGGRIEGVFSWTLRRGEQGARPVACRLAIEEPAGTGIDALAAGAQRETAALADAIAGSVGALLAGGGAVPCES